MDSPLVNLIQGLAQVRDGLTLIAFLTIVMLLAFRTKQVPELIFGLVRDKLTRAEFAKILNRVLIFGFIWFMALLIVTLTSFILDHRSQPGVLKLSDLQAELGKSKASEDAQRHAEADYAQATQMLALHQIDGAIEALKDSLQSAPTLTAQETLLRLYRQKGDLPNASATWEAAMKLATQRGDSIAIARLGKELNASADPAPETDHDLIGASAPLPKGGDRYETAIPLAPGFYGCKETAGCGDRWFRLTMRGGQRLGIKLRTATTYGYTCVKLYGTNGEILTPEDRGSTSQLPCSFTSEAGIFSAAYDSTEAGTYYLRIQTFLGDVLRFRIS